jgi:hypothetical protein
MMKLLLLLILSSCGCAFSPYGGLGSSSKLCASITSDDVQMRSVTNLPPTSSVPLSPNTFAGKLEQALMQRFDETKIDRVITSWRLAEIGYEHREFVGNQQSPPVPVASGSRW